VEEVSTGQLGRAVKAIDSKSIGATLVSSNLTAVVNFCQASLLCTSALQDFYNTGYHFFSNIAIILTAKHLIKESANYKIFGSQNQILPCGSTLDVDVPALTSVET
jgi:hypothetical protein